MVIAIKIQISWVLFRYPMWMVRFILTFYSLIHILMSSDANLTSEEICQGHFPSVVVLAEPCRLLM